jgi:TfoX N-terminal domain
MATPKLDDAAIQRFYAALPEDPRVRRVHMFGMWLGRVGDHYFAGVHKAGVMARLPKPDLDEMLRQGATPWEPMPGRPRPDIVNLPDAIVQDAQLLRGWVRRAFEHALTLPPKVAKKVAKKAKSPKAAKSTKAAKKAKSPKPAEKKQSSGTRKARKNSETRKKPKR